MHVETYGHGPRAVVAFHGWGGDHREFAPIAAHRPPDVRLLSPDLPGYGRSPPPRTWALDSGAWAAMRRSCPSRWKKAMRSAELAGFCSGAIVALAVARCDPERVRRIVVIEPFAFLPWYFRIFVEYSWGPLAYRLSFAHPTGRRLTAFWLRRRQRTNDDFMGAFGRVNHDAVLRWLEMFARVGPLNTFAGLAMPMDLIHGDRTFQAVRASIPLFRRVFPQIRVHELQGVGHLPMIRGARAIARIVFEESFGPADGRDRLA